jgi:hypothetical protein
MRAETSVDGKGFFRLSVCAKGGLDVLGGAEEPHTRQGELFQTTLRHDG